MKSFQKLLVNESEYYEIVKRTTKIEPIREVKAICLGLIVGIVSAFGSIDDEFSWVSLYRLVTSTIMFTLLIWTIYVSIKGTRVISTLVRQPIEVDPFNTTLFEPIGRQSLLIAVVFIGGITLSLNFFGIDLPS